MKLITMMMITKMMMMILLTRMMTMMYEYRGSPEEDVATNEFVDNLALGGDALRQQNTDL